MKNPMIDVFGNKRWYNDKGQYHRENGPAIERNDGSKLWYINGRCHRKDGPAIECTNGTKEWYYNNKFIGGSINGFTQEDFERYLKIREYW